MVRLWPFVILEAAAVAGVGVTVLTSGMHSGNAGSALAAYAPLTRTAALEPPAEIPLSQDLVGTFMGMRDELLLDRMRAAPIAKAKLNRGGSSISMRLDFEDGSRAAFKPEQTHPQTVPRKEVAAYRLNRLLGFHVVPPATLRTVHRDELIGHLPPDGAWMQKRIDAEALFDEEGFTRGELSYWIPVILDSHLDREDVVLEWWQWLSVGQEIPPAKRALMEQLSALLIFDLLTNNSDRFSGGNLMTDPSGQTLYWMDNTFGFQLQDEGHMRCRAYFTRAQKFSRRLVSELRRLDLARLQTALNIEPGVLSDAEMRSLLARRDVALKHIDGLIAQFGDKQVLVFP